MGSDLLGLDRVSAGYHGRAVVRDISLTVSEGSVIAIIGPNGHGKTTLLRCISVSKYENIYPFTGPPSCNIRANTLTL